MSDSNVKAIRKQIRNVVQDLLPEIIKSELTDAIKKQLTEEMGLRMDVIAKGARETLEQIKTKQDDFQNFLVKSMASQFSPQALAPLSPETEDNTAQPAETQSPSEAPAESQQD